MVKFTEEKCNFVTTFVSLTILILLNPYIKKNYLKLYKEWLDSHDWLFVEIYFRVYLTDSIQRNLHSFVKRDRNVNARIINLEKTTTIAKSNPTRTRYREINTWQRKFYAHYILLKILEDHTKCIVLLSYSITWTKFNKK